MKCRIKGRPQGNSARVVIPITQAQESGISPGGRYRFRVVGPEGSVEIESGVYHYGTFSLAFGLSVGQAAEIGRSYLKGRVDVVVLPDR